MENLNDLIWTDEEDSGNNNIRPQEHEPMHEKCMIAFCADSAGNTGYACNVSVYRTAACG